MKDPVRLLSNGSPEVQDLLRSANADAPAHGQLQHLAARLAPTVAAPASATLLPWLFAGAALLGAAGVIMFAHDREHVQPEQPAAIGQRDDETLPSPQPEAAAPPAAIASPAAPEPAPARAPATKRKETPAVATKQPARQPQPAAPQELELLTPAQTALHANDFEHALALAERHASLYAAGTFAEEREAIAIEALQKLGRRDQARSRLTTFTAHYPHSGYRARLERTVRE
jgi:hypothetical protein